jgi:mRNA-degrading endonuclease YafQ of YafQ-DinJ toxin-antitoxin module
MAAEPYFSTHEFSDRFKKSYKKASDQLQKQVLGTVQKLIGDPTPGLETHTIKPDKYYWEAYINDGDRLIYRPEGRHLKVVDFVGHDDIGRYGKAPADG